MAQDQGQTVVEGLKKLLGNLPQLLTLPDSDQDASQFIMSLQQAITGFIKDKQSKAAGLQQQQAMQAAGMGGQGGGAGPGGPGAGPMGGGPGQPVQMGPGGKAGGGMTGLAPQITDPEELRKMLAGVGGSPTPGGAT